MLALVAARLVVNETNVADWVVAPLIVADVSGPTDAIVVLGAGVIGECTPNLHSLRRVLLGVGRWRERPTSVLLFSGGSGGPCPVAQAMARTARELGVPADRIRVETASTDTHENAVMSVALLRGWGLSRILLVTDRLHMRRAHGVFDGHGLKIERASVPIYEGHEDNVSMLTAGLREYLALAYYRARGWLARPGGRIAEPTPTYRSARPQPAHPDGPIVVLGASYAAGLPLKAVGDVLLINRGVAGQESSDLLERFDRDVVAARPRSVLLWGFINDVVRAPADEMDTTLARIRTNYSRMIERARELGIIPVLATEVTIGPPPGLMSTVMEWAGRVRGRRSYQDRINGHVLSVNAWLLEVASREGLLVLDLQRVLEEPGGRRRTAFTQPDGSHITDRGYDMLVAYAEPILQEYFRDRY